MKQITILISLLGFATSAHAFISADPTPVNDAAISPSTILVGVDPKELATGSVFTSSGPAVFYATHTGHADIIHAYSGQDGNKQVFHVGVSADGNGYVVVGNDPAISGNFAFISSGAACILSTTTVSTHTIFGVRDSGAVDLWGVKESGLLFVGDGDSGLRESSDDNMRFQIAGTDQIDFTGAWFRGIASQNFSIAHSQANSGTAPTYTFVGDTDSGVGSQGADHVNVIAGGTSEIIVTPSSVSIPSGDFHVESGNVGIGTTNPLEGLHVDGSGVRVDTNTEHGAPAFYVAPTDGQIGIGLTNPGRRVHIYEDNGNEAPNLKIEQAGEGDAAIHFLLTAVKSWGIGSNNDQGNAFMISEEENLDTNPRLTIATGGNVGIGTTNPYSAMEVEGTLTADNIVSSSTIKAAGEIWVGTGQYLRLGTSGSTSPGLYAGAQKHLIGFWGGSERFRITNAGGTSWQGQFTLDGSSLTVQGAGQFGTLSDGTTDYLTISDEGGSGAPTAADCDDASEQGRMTVDGVNFRMYICMAAWGRGWDYFALTD